MPAVFINITKDVCVNEKDIVKVERTRDVRRNAYLIEDILTFTVGRINPEKYVVGSFENKDKYNEMLLYFLKGAK